MSDEQKKTASEEEDDCIDENSNDNDQYQNAEAGNETPSYNLNDAVHSTNDLRSNTQQDLFQNFDEAIEVEPIDVRTIPLQSDEACHKLNSSESLETNVSYEYPSDSDEVCLSNLPPVYFDSIQCAEKAKYVNIEDIHPVSVHRESRKERKWEVQDYSSDEFADTEDNSEDNLTDSKLDSKELLEDITAKWMTSNSKKRQIADASENSTQERKNKVSEKNKASENIPSNKQEDNKLPITADSEPSCSGFPQSASKRTKISSSQTLYADKTAKTNLPTILEEPELEDDSQNLKINPPSNSKNKPMKMKARVGKRKDKCNVCNVRLGLCAIRCRCGGYYCAKHRYDKEHNCTFDYKTMGAEEIRKNNPKVIAEKVRKL